MSDSSRKSPEKRSQRNVSEGCETCEMLEQRNRKLRREVDSLSEEQRHLSETLRAHEPLCPMMHCSLSSSNLHTDTMTACRTF
ncbi:basic leucine zipper transcriptional factor ATF-like 3 isoform X2 [Pseudochaenichthys georgianus]|uniref:basic leucine zipper transcriptional factor ATF-like 3 isoform X2 n=1 Tax=Pseudochaenichthys georgianus TaxID=52239 RepID=UPI00146F5BD7|nr:basic leucine zipper transcriptional factor ATF-like 3 isoform X2 [Pseudochaenichthys georgianus]